MTATGKLRFRDEPGFALYVERGGFLLHTYLRRFDPPYGNGNRWTRGFALRVRGRYLAFRTNGL